LQAGLAVFQQHGDHLVTLADGTQAQFRYHYCQREAIETLIYLSEVRGVRSLYGLMGNFGGAEAETAAAGVNPDEDRCASSPAAPGSPCRRGSMPAAAGGSSDEGFVQNPTRSTHERQTCCNAPPTPPSPDRAQRKLYFVVV
jgi:hypothetical protein